MVVPLIPSKTGWAQLKSGGHRNFFSALRAEIVTTTTVPVCPSTFKILPALMTGTGTGKEDGFVFGLMSAGPGGRNGIPERPSCKYPASI